MYNHFACENYSSFYHAQPSMHHEPYYEHLSQHFVQPVQVISSSYQQHCTASKQQGAVSRISKIREITAIGQLQGESLCEYWNRFNELCASCPNHQISEDLLILYFCDGLSEIDRIMIDAASGGSLMDKTVSEVRSVISQLCGAHIGVAHLTNPVCKEPAQSFKEFEVPTDLHDVQSDFDVLNILNVEPKRTIAELAVVVPIYSEIVETALAIEHIGVDNIAFDSCNNVNNSLDLEAILNDDIFEINENVAAELEFYANFDFHSSGAVFLAEFEQDAAAVNELKDAKLLQLQHKTWLEQFCTHMEPLDKVVELRASKLKSSFLSFLFKYNISRFTILSLASYFSIENSMVENRLYFIKLKRINFDMWPI